MGESVPQNFEFLGVELSELLDSEKLMQQRHDGIPPELMLRQ